MTQHQSSYRKLALGTIEVAKKAHTEPPIDVDGIHNITLDGSYVLIDMFALRPTDKLNYERELTTRIRMPAAQFHYFAKTLPRSSEKIGRQKRLSLVKNNRSVAD